MGPSPASTDPCSPVAGGLQRLLRCVVVRRWRKKWTGADNSQVQVVRPRLRAQGGVPNSSQSLQHGFLESKRCATSTKMNCQHAANLRDSNTA